MKLAMRCLRELREGLDELEQMQAAALKDADLESDFDVDVTADGRLSLGKSESNRDAKEERQVSDRQMHKTSSA